VLTAPVSAVEYLSGLHGDDRVEELVFGHRWRLPRTPCSDAAGILSRLAILLTQYLAGAPAPYAIVKHPADLILDERVGLVLHPPLVLVLSERASILRDSTRVSGPPNLVVELLCPSSARRIRHTKFRWYGSYGVDELWMIDTRCQRVEVASYWMRKRPVPNIYSGSTPIKSPLLPRLSFRPADLFGDVMPLLDPLVSSLKGEPRP
jgi:Uma2 family endonuclease